MPLRCACPSWTTSLSYVLGVRDGLKYPHSPKRLLTRALGDLLPGGGGEQAQDGVHAALGGVDAT